MLDDKVQRIKKTIPQPLWNKARSSALEQGITITEWVEIAMRLKLEHDKVNS